MAGHVRDRFLVPGRVYRDLDGTLVHLVAVERGLCSWVAATDGQKAYQVTHSENFRRRFRAFDDQEIDPAKAAAA